MTGAATFHNVAQRPNSQVCGGSQIPDSRNTGCRAAQQRHTVEMMFAMTLQPGGSIEGQNPYTGVLNFLRDP